MYQNPDGTYSYTTSLGGGNGIMPQNFVPIPVGTRRDGTYHTHGAYDPNMNGDGNPAPGSPGYRWRNDGNEIFSPADRDASDQFGPGYLGTPQGTTEEYFPNPGHPAGWTVTVLNGGNCGCH